MEFDTLAVHAGSHIDPATRAVTSPIHLSTTFERAADLSFPGGHNYIRSGNPNRAALEECLTLLEGGAATAAFSSGQAATASVFQALRPGDHVVAPLDAYYGTPKLLREVFSPWGLEASFVDMTNLDEVRKAVRPNTKLIWVETPSNPVIRVTDIAGVAEIAQRAKAHLACDNTWATPMLQRPFDLGADLVMHSTTKYLGGHSDLQGGAIVTKKQDEMFKRIRLVQVEGGAVPSPFDCWLLLRGIRSLPHRMRGHCENARRVAEYLASHRAVEVVHYPGLSTHVGHSIAQRQMKDFGGMLSFQVHGGRAEAVALTERLALFTRATSLGGPESLIEHRASVEGPTTRTPESLLRVSVGLEHPEDLIADLRNALGSR